MTDETNEAAAAEAAENEDSPESPVSETPGAPASDEVARDLEATREQLLRSMAEFDNFKKRVDRERSDFRRLVASEILKETLPILDSLQLAVSAGGSGEDLRSGIELILAQMEKLLERFKVEPIPAEGEPFDPAVHDAIARFEDPSVAEHTVAEELQRGYKIEGRLLRPAMVRVAIPPETDSSADGG